MPTDKRARQKEGRRARLEARRRVNRRRQLVRRAVIVVIVAAVVTGSVLLITRQSPTPPTTTTTTSTTTTTTTTLPANFRRQQAAANAVAVRAGCPAELPTVAKPTTTKHWSTEPAYTLKAHTTYYATVHTTKGAFKFRMNTANAPVNSNNFVFLAEHGFYTCTPFWRVITGFVNQGGDPTGQGAGGPGYSVVQDEYPVPVATGRTQYPAGSVAMANSGPHTNQSQFFVVAKNLTGQDLAPNYTIIGQVVSGMAVVTAINQQGSAGGVPPDVTNRVLSIAITTS